MLDCFTTSGERARPLHVIAAAAAGPWLEGRPARWRAWLEGIGYRAQPGNGALLPGPDGAPEAALLVVGERPSPFDVAAAYARLPDGDWRIETEGAIEPAVAALGWALGSYRFDRYRKVEPVVRRLTLAGGAESRTATIAAEAVFLARDLINTPASDLGPAELAVAVEEVAGRYGASVRTLVGEDLLEQGYPAVFAVGHGSPRTPRVIDLAFGDAQAPQVTLVGKGVCFDTGGLDIKPAANMLLMKKDMGGAAVALALAQAVMALDLPVRLRLLIGAVENSISGTSFRPGDVIRTRKGLTVEVGNTDAEGRVVLADLLAEADAGRPDLIIDCATLTGAARVALGPDLPALFTPDDALAEDLLAAGRGAFDPLWRLPLHEPYREMIESKVADIDNAGKGGLAGAITAALFLKSFVSETGAWAHLDIYGWSQSDRPGRPKGGEASALRALIAFLERRFAA
ncbi:MAG TPA: leucyl aminopeptidase family protein [Geminicoccaceae bacterium]